MQQLHLVGFTTDRTALIFSVRRGAKSGGFTIAVDDRLLEALDEAKAFLAAAEAAEQVEAPAVAARERPESQLSVREVQARLRRGQSIDAVAADAHVDPAWVARFAPPVLTELAEVVRTVRATRFTKQRLGPSGAPLGEAVYRNLVERGVTTPREDLDKSWRARQLADGRWEVSFRYRSRGRDQQVAWSFDDATGKLVARDRLASQLAYREGPPPPKPRARRTTTPPPDAPPEERPTRPAAAKSSKRVAAARKAATARLVAEAQKATKRDAAVARKAAKRPARKVAPAPVAEDPPEPRPARPPRARPAQVREALFVEEEVIEVADDEPRLFADLVADLGPDAVAEAVTEAVADAVRDAVADAPVDVAPPPEPAPAAVSALVDQEHGEPALDIEPLAWPERDRPASPPARTPAPAVPAGEEPAPRRVLRVRTGAVRRVPIDLASIPGAHPPGERPTFRTDLARPAGSGDDAVPADGPPRRRRQLRAR